MWYHKWGQVRNAVDWKKTTDSSLHLSWTQYAAPVIHTTEESPELAQYTPGLTLFYFDQGDVYKHPDVYINDDLIESLDGIAVSSVETIKNFVVTHELGHCVMLARPSHHNEDDYDGYGTEYFVDCLMLPVIPIDVEVPTSFCSEEETAWYIN
jgi:Zn-dependent peptidase ImmA (M78 family)